MFNRFIKKVFGFFARIFGKKRPKDDDINNYPLW